MDEEIDLRPYLELLVRKWYLIVGAAVLGGLLAFSVTSLRADVYQATALVAVTQDRLIAQFDPRFDNSEEPQPLKVLPELAVSDELVMELLASIDPPLEEIETLTEFRNLLEATPGSDPSLIRLSASHTVPVDAARISNRWASLFVDTANELFGDGDGEQLTFFEDQLALAEEELTSAETDRIEYQGVNRQAILSNEVNALRDLQKRLLAEQQNLEQLESSLKDFRDKIAEADEGISPSFADQLTALILQLRVFNPSLDLPLQLQLDGTGSLSGSTRDEQLDILDDLQESVTSRLSSIETELAEMEPHLLSLQEDLLDASSVQNRLTLNKDVAQETYLSLARKVDEERITTNDMTRGIRLASEAAVPEEPEGPRQLFIGVGAVVVGAVIASVLLILSEWWRGSNESIES